MRDCLEEARQNNEPLELLDRDVLLDDLRACYRIISAWPTRQATPALPGIALPSAAESPAALGAAAESPAALPAALGAAAEAPSALPAAAEPPAALPADAEASSELPSADESPAVLPAAASNEDFASPDDSVSEDDLEPSMGDDLEPSKGDDLPIAENTAAAQIEWIVGDPPREEDQEEDTSEYTVEDSAEDTVEGGRLSIDATFSAEEAPSADEPFLEMSEEERGHEAAIEHAASIVQEATNEFEPVDETEAANVHEAFIVHEATNDFEPVDETEAAIEHEAVNEHEVSSEHEAAIEHEVAIEAKAGERAPEERTQRTEWYTPSLFELSTDHPTTPHTQEDPGSITAHDDHLMSAVAENGNSEAAVVGGPSRIEQLIQSSKDGAARLADARLRPVTDIKKGLGLNEKFLLMRSFFNNDAMRFTADLDQLNRLNSLQEAEEMLFDKLLPGRHWDAQSEADLTLFLIIYRRFSAR